MGERVHLALCGTACLLTGGVLAFSPVGTSFPRWHFLVLAWFGACGLLAVGLGLARSWRAKRVKPKRTPEQYAIEHGRYLVEAARRMMDTITVEAAAEDAGEEPDTDAMTDAWRGLREAIHQFEKRADFAERVSP